VCRHMPTCVQVYIEEENATMAYPKRFNYKISVDAVDAVDMGL